MSRINRLWVAGIFASSLALFGCSDGDSSTPTETACPSGNEVGGVCAGVPVEALCDGSACTDGGACSAVETVSDDNTLATVAGNAQPGTCIQLAPGNYAQVVLPDGVSVFGRSASEVTVGRVELSGSDSRVGGITVGAGGIDVNGSGALVRAVRIQDSGTDGVMVASGGSVTVQHSEIIGSARYGVSAFDASAVTIEASIIRDSKGPGVWVQCNGDCASCSGAVQATIKDSALTGNAIVGLSLVGTLATLENVKVANTTVGPNFEAGGGVSVSKCSVLTATQLSISNSEDFGLLIHDSDASVSGASVSGNLRGVWLQDIGSSGAAAARLEGLLVSDNEGVGLGVGNSGGIEVLDSEVQNTASIALPVLVNGISAGAENVGDGLTWLGGSSLVLQGLTLSNSARASVLIDGEVGAGSSITDATLSGGDELLGIVQQNLPSGGVTPAVGGSTPTLSPDAAERFSVPTEVAVPPGI